MRTTRAMPFPIPRVLEMVIVAIAVLSGVARAQQRSAPTKARNIVLVHGAWADGSSWNSVIERLQRAGYTVTAVQLGLSSLDEDVAKTHAGDATLRVSSVRSARPCSCATDRSTRSPAGAW